MAPSQNSTISSLKILYWNARSYKQRRLELPSVLKNIDIFICVESWLSSSDVIRNSDVPTGFIVYRKDRTISKGGGILIFIRKNVAFFEIKDIVTPLQSVEICGLRITNLNPIIDLIVCYRAPGLLTQNQWSEIVSNVKINKNCILVGDFNSHHVSWNCAHSDTNGLRLFDAIESNNLFLHNKSITYTNINNRILI